MHSAEVVQRVLSLIDEGLNDCEIERRTGIPRRTVLGWRHGRVPKRWQAGNPDGSCVKCGHAQHEFELLPQAEYACLLGMYLGDGCISRAPRGVFVLRIVLDRKYPEIVDECSRAAAAVMPTSKVGVYSHPHQNVEQVGSYSKAWPCLLPQHGAGKKHERSIQLTEWQLDLVNRDPRPLLRGLIHSDGCRSVNTIRHPKKTYAYDRYLFSNLSDDIRQIFCDACDLIGVAWRRMNSANISVARRSSVERLDAFIGPKR